MFHSSCIGLRPCSAVLHGGARNRFVTSPDQALDVLIHARLTAARSPVLDPRYPLCDEV